MYINKIIQTQNFNGIEINGLRENSNKVNTTTNAASNPIETLIPANRSLVANPTLSSEFLNEADLSRYKKVQMQWAESFSKRKGIPIENILARIPDVKFKDMNTIFQNTSIAEFDLYQNVIQITPIRELANVIGGDEAKIVHESAHAYLYNLRRAMCKNIAPEQVIQGAVNLVLTKMLKGEHGSILRTFTTENVNGNTVIVPKMMNVPILAQHEREAIVKTINSLQLEHLEINNQTGDTKLSDLGKKNIEEHLMPQLDEYSRTSAISADEQFKRISNYIDSFFTRRNTVVFHMLNPTLADSTKNIETPLCEAEINLANSSFDVLSAQEPVFLMQQDAQNHLLSERAYFNSFEERFTREEESVYRFEQSAKKIQEITKKGLKCLKPAEALLKEHQTAQTNLSLLELVDVLNQLEQQIIAAPKDPAKIARLHEMKRSLLDLAKDNQDLIDLDKFLSGKGLVVNGMQSEEIKAMISRELSPHKASLFDSLQDFLLNCVKRQTEIIDANTPRELLLADTAENKALAANYDRVISKIRKLAPQSDLSSLPRCFYNSDAEYNKMRGINTKLILKWIKRLSKLR